MKLKLSAAAKTRIIANSIVVAVGIALFMLISNISIIFNGFNRITVILTPFIYGFVIAYLLYIPMNFIEERLLSFLDKKKKNKLKRTLSILITYVAAVVLIIAIFSVIIPELVSSMSILVENIPTYGVTLEKYAEAIFNKYSIDMNVFNNVVDDFRNISTYISQMAGAALTYLFQFSANITQSIFNIFVGTIISIYVLAGKEKFSAQTKKVVYAVLPKKHAEYLVDLTRSSNKIFVSFLGGKLLDSLIIGIICFICMSILKMPYALLVSFIIGITNIVPVFGPFIGAVPSALIIFIVSPSKAFWFIIFVLVLQQFDGNILGPKILGDSTGLSAFWVIFAILAANGLFGFVGMVIGVPLFAVIYSIIVSIINDRLKAKGLPVDTDDYKKDEI